MASKGFQIKNAEGVAISLNDLDIEAATFWGKKVEEKSYADPTPEFTNPDNLEGDELFRAKMKHEFSRWSNWKDQIGWYIAYQKNYTSGWNNVIYTMCAESFGRKILGDEYTLPEFKRYEYPRIEDGIIQDDPIKTIHLPDDIEEKIYGAIQYYKPYIALIKHWESLGYIPESVEVL